MKLLEERIMAEGIVEGKSILRVDGFLNCQVDTELMKAVARDFAEHFHNQGITKVVTIESSGITPALLTAMELGVPLIILKKQPSKVVYPDLLQTLVASDVKETTYELTMSPLYMKDDDHCLIIDDFLANGESAAGAVRLIRMAHATIAGAGFMIEKTFKQGRNKLVETGIAVYSQVKVASLEDGRIILQSKN